MATNGKDLKHKTSLEERESRKAIPWPNWIPWRAEVWGLLRAARQKTQAEVAEALRVPTSAVSRIERRQDCRISTLQRYVAALGGQLEMRAVFPDGAVDLNTLMDTSTCKQESD